MLPPNITPAERDARLAQLTGVFADRIVLFVDAHEVRAAAVEYIPPGRRPGTRKCTRHVSADRHDAARRHALAVVIRAGRRSVSAGDSSAGWLVNRRMDRRHQLERRHRSLEEFHAADAARDRAAVPVARLHPHPAERPRSHPVRARHLPAQPAMEDDAAASDGVHRRALDHAGPVDLRHRLAAVTDRRAADCALDRLRRDRKPPDARAEAVASRAGLHVRPVARPRICGRVEGAWLAARGISHGAGHVQPWRGGWSADGDRRGADGRGAVHEKRLVPPTRGDTSLDCDCGDRSLLDRRTIA